MPVYGGQKITAQMKFLKHSPEILVGTPGRVIDLLDRRIINFDNIRFVVLDEVDRMLDIGFRDDIRNILSARARAAAQRRDTRRRDRREADERARRSGDRDDRAEASARSRETRACATRRCSSPPRSPTRSRSWPAGTCASRSRS